MTNERPRGALFGDPSATVVWAGICALDEATQHDVLRELQTRLSVFDTRKGDINQKRARAIAALRQAAQLLGGKSPSVNEYQRLLRENPALKWPADGTLRRWMGGGWNDALEQAHLEPVAEPLAAEPGLGPRFSNDELTTALKQCAVELGRTPTSDQYMLWANRPDVRLRPGRRPTSIGTFQRRFGGWVAALTAAGLTQDDVSGKPFTNGRKEQYTDEELFQAMLRISQRVGGTPTVTRYSAERKKILEEEHEARAALPAGSAAPDETKPNRSFPTYGVGVHRFGSWTSFKSEYKTWKEGRR